MPEQATYSYRNLGPLYRALDAYFRARGVIREGKLIELRCRWLKQKGERFPPACRRNP